MRFVRAHFLETILITIFSNTALFNNTKKFKAQLKFTFYAAVIPNHGANIETDKIDQNPITSHKHDRLTILRIYVVVKNETVG